MLHVTYNAIISFVTFTLATAVTFYVFALNPRERLNRYFPLLGIGVMIYSLGDFGMRLTGLTGDISYGNNHANYFSWVMDWWPFSLALMCHYIFLYSSLDRNISRKALVLYPYLPGIVLSLIGVAGFFSNKWYIWTSDFYATTIIVSGLYMLMHNHMRIKGMVESPFKTRLLIQSWFFASGMIFMIIVASGCEIVPYYLNVQVVDFAQVGFGCFELVLAYSIWRYKSFNISDRAISEYIADMISDSLILTDLQGVVVEYNKIAAQLLPGLHQGESLSERLPELAEMIPSIVWHKRLDDKDLRQYSISAAVVNDELGRQLGIIFTIRDISQRQKSDSEKHQQEELKHMLELEQQTIKSIRDIVGSVAHEINSPLLALSISQGMLSKQLKKNIKDEALLQETLELVQIQTDSITKIRNHIDNLRKFSKLHSTEKITDININNEISTVEEISTFMQPSNVQIINKLDKMLPTFKGDAPAINQMLMAVLSLSMHSIASDVEGLINIISSYDNEYFQIIITDNGSAINAPEKNFNLQLARDIAVRHGGDLRVNAGNQGNQFVVRIKGT